MGERVVRTAQRAHLNIEEEDSGSAEEVNKVAERAGEDIMGLLLHSALQLCK